MKIKVNNVKKQEMNWMISKNHRQIAINETSFILFLWKVGAVWKLIESQLAPLRSCVGFQVDFKQWLDITGNLTGDNMQIKIPSQKYPVSFSSYADDNFSYHHPHRYPPPLAPPGKIIKLLESHAKLVEVLAEKGVLNSIDVHKVLQGKYNVQIELVKDE